MNDENSRRDGGSDEIDSSSDDDYEFNDIFNDDNDGESSEKDDSDDTAADKPDIHGIKPSVKRGGRTCWKEVDVNRVGDTGHCGRQPVRNANVSVLKDRRIILLNDALGLSATSHLIDSMLAAVMETHVTLVEQREKRKQPIGHMAACWISKYHRDLDFCYISGHSNYFSYPKLYRDARTVYNNQQGANQPAAVIAVDTLRKNFASALVSSSKARLEKYWPMLLAL